MNRMELFLTSLVAAIPAGGLAFVLVMAFLTYGNLPTMLMALVVLTLLGTLLPLVAFPVGALVAPGLLGVHSVASAGDFAQTVLMPSQHDDGINPKESGLMALDEDEMSSVDDDEIQDLDDTETSEFDAPQIEAVSDDEMTISDSNDMDALADSDDFVLEDEDEPAPKKKKK